MTRNLTELKCKLCCIHRIQFIFLPRKATFLKGPSWSLSCLNLSHYQPSSTYFLLVNNSSSSGLWCWASSSGPSACPPAATWQSCCCPTASTPLTSSMGKIFTILKLSRRTCSWWSSRWWTLACRRWVWCWWCPASWPAPYCKPSGGCVASAQAGLTSWRNWQGTTVTSWIWSLTPWYLFTSCLERKLWELMEDTRAIWVWVLALRNSGENEYILKIVLRLDNYLT